MKVLWLLSLLAAISPSLSAPDPSSLQDSIQLTPEAEKLLEELVEIAGDHDPSDSDRTRRTSNFLDKKKFSLGSISSFHHDDKHDKYPDFEHKAFNIWGLKKAILLSLFQAIKAITGGVIAVKGHLIKGGGKIVEASGKILEHKGAAVANFGKHVAYKALSKPIHLPELSGYGQTGYGHIEGGHTGGGQIGGGHYGGHGAPVYGPPSPSEHHHFYHHPTGPSGYDYPHLPIHAKSGQVSSESTEHKDKKTLPDGLQAGLIVLKPMKNEGGSGGPSGGPSGAPGSGFHHLHQDDGYYKFASTGQKEDGFYKFDPIGDFSEQTPQSQIGYPTSVSFFSQSVPSYDKPSISRSIEYDYFVPHY